MFKFFKKGKESGQALQMADIDGKPLKEGDLVESLRYDMGQCRLVQTPQGMVYRSVDSVREIHWSKMVDAATKNQKVRKITE